VPRTLKLTLEYDGSNYVGWQRQAAGISIQGLIEDALLPFEGAPVTVHGAGRTDAGVHALGQVASAVVQATHDVETMQRALNAVLPVDVRVLRVEEAARDFHARFSATGKTYEYRIVSAPFVSAFLHRYVWHVPQHLDLEAMRYAAATFIGTHDFAAFRTAGSPVSSTVRTIEEIVWQPGSGPADPLILRVTGNGFLRHMVRTIVGSLIEVGLGRWRPERIAEVLRGRDRRAAGDTAPPAGLFLIRVRY